MGTRWRYLTSSSVTPQLHHHTTVTTISWSTIRSSSRNTLRNPCWFTRESSTSACGCLSHKTWKSSSSRKATSEPAVANIPPVASTTTTSTWQITQCKRTHLTTATSRMVTSYHSPISGLIWKTIMLMEESYRILILAFYRRWSITLLSRWHRRKENLIPVGASSALRYSATTTSLIAISMCGSSRSIPIHA